MRNETQTRYAFLDALRILAIFGVLMAHWTWSGTWVDQVFADDPVSVFGEITFLSRYGFLGVHLFFMISGAVIMKSARRRTAVSFIWARIIRIMPLYLIAVVIAATIEYLQDVRETSEILMRTLKSLVFLASSKDDSWINPVFWTLKIEMQFYLLIAILIFVRRKNRELFLISVLTLIVLIFTFTNTQLESQIELVGSLPFFLIGMLAACESKRQHRIYISVGIIGLLLIGTENVIRVSDMNMRSESVIFIILLFAAACTAVAFWSKAVSSYKSRPLNRWGMTTYAVYLFHIDPFRPFIEKLIASGVGTVPSYLISASMLIIFSHGITHIVELYICNKLRNLKHIK